MSYKASIEAEGNLSRLFEAELKESRERTSYEVREEKGKTIFEIKAKDAVGLKIATNSITKMLEVIEKINKA